MRVLSIVCTLFHINVFCSVNFLISHVILKIEVEKSWGLVVGNAAEREKRHCPSKHLRHHQANLSNTSLKMCLSLSLSTTQTLKKPSTQNSSHLLFLHRTVREHDFQFGRELVERPSENHGSNAQLSLSRHPHRPGRCRCRVCC